VVPPESLELLDTRMRVATWNVWWRFGPWERRQPVIMSTLARIDADVVALQESWEVPGRRSQAAELGAALGYHHAFASGFDAQEALFGNALLSRWPIVATETRQLPTVAGSEEFRVVLKAVIDGPRGPFEVYVTHLNWRFDESHVRQGEVRALAQLVAESVGRTFPPIVCGDFNSPPDADEVRMLTGRMAVPVPRLVFLDAWEVAGEGAGHTWRNANPFAAHDLEPDRRIDYVFVGWPKARGAGHVTRAWVDGTEPIDGMHGSDHAAVVAELRY
jgi:endonuclease/exonuclease/phosphatase family metal-dependent hydrolase